MSKIHLVTYVDDKSANYDSERDFEIGEIEKQVGNSSTLKYAQNGDVVLISCRQGKRFKFVRIGNKIPNFDIRSDVWKNHGGGVWKYNFEIEMNLTDVINRSDVIQKFIRKECKLEGKINQVFNIHYVNVDYNNIYNKLLLRLQSGDDMQDPICRIISCKHKVKDNGLCGRHKNS